MAYQDDFRNKVLQALKAKNLAVDISQEATQQAIVEEAQNVANSESRPMSPEEMRQVLQDVANQLAAENQQFSAQSYDFTAYAQQIAGGGAYGNYPSGGFALSTASKDIMMIPTAGTAGTVNTLSQIDFKYLYNPNAYGVIDPNEIKSSIYNWAERIPGTLFDTPVLGFGGAWGGVSYTPNTGYGIGASQGSGVGGSIYTNTGRGNLIFLRPAISTINAALFNDLGLDSTAGSYYFTITGYNPAVPNATPTAGFAVSFGGIGGSGPIGISGALSGSQYNQIKFLSPFTVQNSTVTDTLALGLSASGNATTQLFVSGASGQANANYVLSAAESPFARGDLFYSSGSGHTNLTRLSLGANNTYLSSNGDRPFWTNTIAANTVSVNPAIGSTVLYPLLNNANGSGSAVSTDTDFSVDPGNNILRYSSGTFYVGTAVSSPTFTSSASLAIKPGANATTAIALQKADGTNILVVDTTNNLIGINKTPSTYALDISGDTNVATGNVYRINGTQVLSSTQVFGVTVSSSVITGGSWSATAITTNYGGTGFQTYSIGDILYAGTANSLGRLPIGTLNQFLSSNGTIPQWVSGTGLTVGYAYQITTAQTNLATTLYPLFANSSTGAIGASIDTDIVYNALANILTVPSVWSGTALSSPTITSSASLAIKPGANSTTAIQLQKADGTNILVVDSTNNLVGINKTPATYALDVSGSANISTGNAYYINGTSVLNATTLGTNVVTSSLTTVGVIGTGIWNGTAIGLTYGGTGSNLGPGAAIGNSNRIIVTGNTGSYASSLIDNATTGYLLVSGGSQAAPTFTNTTAAAFTFSSGTLTINNAAITTGTITGVPTNGTDIVNKTYADSISGGLDVHASVRLTTISAIGGSYRQVGTAGTTWGQGDYIIATTPAELIGVAAGLDTPTSGIALTNGQRVLVKDGVLGGYATGAGAYAAFSTITTYGGIAASYVANGIYTVTSYGGAATSGWVLVRATDTDNGSGVQELTGGTFTFVEEGSTYADNAFVCTNDTTSYGAIGFGATQIAWSPFSGGAALSMGQGLAKTGNILATNFNLTNDGNLVSGITYKGFAIGGARSSSVGSSSQSTFTVTSNGGANDVATSILVLNATGFKLSGGTTNRGITIAGTGDQTLTVATDGFTHQGGSTNSRTLTIIGGDIQLNGGGFGLTLQSNSVLNFNRQSLTITAGSGDVTLTGSANNATTQNIITSGTAQYQLSTPTNTWSVGDMYYGSGTAFSALTRLAFSSSTGQSVLIRNSAAPVWGTINLASSDFVSGILGVTNGGTNNNASPTAGSVVYGTGTAYAYTLAGTGESVLISNGTIPIWSSINLASANAVRGTLTVQNGGTGAGTFTLNGILYGNNTGAIQATGAAANSVLVTSAGNVPSLSTDIPTAVTIGTAYIYRVGGTDVSLADGGTNNSLTAVNGAVAYSDASKIVLTNAGNGGSVLISNGTNPLFSAINLASSNAVTGVLPIANGGSNATASNFSSNGVVIYDSGNTRLASATGATLTGGTGLSITGTVASSGGFFISGNSVVTNVAGIYGSVGFTSQASNGGTSYIQTSGQSLILNYPGTGITGTGLANQVAYYSASSTLTGNVGLVYNPTAATGVGLSVNVNTTTGSVFSLNTISAMTAGFLIDADIAGVQRFGVDWKGMATLTNNSALGNTALIVLGGRTILATANANYATVNLPSSSGTNPGAGITQIGDLWFNGTNLYFRKDATTNFDLLVGSVSGSGTANKIAKWSSTTGLTDSNISDAGLGMTITSTNSIATASTGATALLTLQTISGDNSLTDRYFVRGVTSAGARLFSVDTAGNLRATTKSFDIPHPTKDGMRLVYGVLEGPEHGVYHRGTVEGKGVIQVDLPEYWHKLVGDQYTIQLTPWGNYNVSIGAKTENYFTIQLVGDFISRKFKNIKVDYIVHGSRLDAPLDTEQ